MSDPAKPLPLPALLTRAEQPPARPSPDEFLIAPPTTEPGALLFVPPTDPQGYTKHRTWSER